MPALPDRGWRGRARHREADPMGPPVGAMLQVGGATVKWAGARCSCTWPEWETACPYRLGSFPISIFVLF
jgi:hypothetical protein